MVPEDRTQINELITVAADLQKLMETRRWQFCFIDGVAVQAWSEPRYTNDVDLTLLTGFGNEGVYIDVLLDHYTARVNDAKAFGLANRVLLLQDHRGIGIDVALGSLPIEEAAVQRAGQVEVYPGVNLRICSPEDLIVMKAFAGREQDWRDVRMTIVRRGLETLDWTYILRYLGPLAEAKEEPEIMTRLELLRAEYSGG